MSDTKILNLIDSSSCEIKDEMIKCKKSVFPLVSVIVVTYKHGNKLFETLQSIFEQDYPNIQLIVAEDGFSDFNITDVNTFIIEKKKINISNYIIIHPDENRGTVKNINNALRLSCGEFIKIIAGDDTYPNSQVFSKQIEYLQVHQSDDIVIGNTIECDSYMNYLPVEGASPRKIKKLISGPRQNFLRYICQKELSIVSTQVSCYRKSFFNNLGYYDERYKLIEDIPMAVRIISSNTSIGYIDFPCVCHRKGTGVSTSNNAFDPERMVYYIDLLKCFENVFIPIKCAVGKHYVNMRYRLLRFRIEYAKLNENKISKYKRIILILKNICPIIYYTINNAKRITFYFGKKRI